jgi:hypothetical protein
LSPLTFKDSRKERSFDPEQENTILLEGLQVPVHMMDDLQKHMQSHMQALQMTGDPTGLIKLHMQAHMQMAQAMQAQAAQQQLGPPQPPQGPQGGNGAGPRAGAAPGQQRPAQQPAGAIHADRMKDPMAAPRM